MSNNVQMVCSINGLQTVLTEPISAIPKKQLGPRGARPKTF